MNNAFDRVILNSRERPLSSDLNQHFSQVDMMMRETMRGFFLAHSQYAKDAGLSAFQPRSGFLGDGFFVTASGAASVMVQPGLGFIFGALGSTTPIDSIPGLLDLSNYYPVYMPVALNVPIPAPGSGNERYDIVEVKLDVRRQDAASRDVFDDIAGIFVSASLQKTLAYVLDTTRYGAVTSPTPSSAGISLKKGVAATIGTAVPPATTAGYTRIAIVYSTGTSVVINQNNVQDRRRLLFPDGSTTLGYIVTQTFGAPDVVAITTYPVAPAGVRIAARSLAPAGGQMKFYIFAGEAAAVADDPPTWTPGGAYVAAYPIATLRKVAPSGFINSIPSISPVSPSVIDSAEKTALSAIIDVDVGQPYVYFTGDRTDLSTPPTAIAWNIMCPLRYL